MNIIVRTNWRDLPLSLLLGIGFCGLMGFLHGLRILDMTPDLVTQFKNIFFLLLYSTYLYALLGVIVGVGLWTAMWLYSKLFKKAWHGRLFVRKWISIYLFFAAILLAYLAATRQDLRSGNFDNLLLAVYFFSALLLGKFLARSIRRQRNVLTGKRSRWTLKRFFGISLLYFIIVMGLALVSATTSDDNQVYGDKNEIEAALEQPDLGTRVAIIGWDGGEWTVIEELLEKGYLPNLQRLIDQGVSAPFRSLPSTKSPLVWTSIATGKVPAKHGIIDFGSFQFPGMANNFTAYPDGLGFYRLLKRIIPKSDLPVTSSTRRCEAYWNIFSKANRSVGVVGWWATWPAESVNGFILSDRFTYTLFNPIASALSLREGQTYPPELLDEVDSFCRLPNSITEEEFTRFMPHTGGLKDYPENWGENKYQDWNPMYQFKLAYTASESFKEAGLYLYQQYKPSMFSIYFQGIDMISHFFWQYYRPEEFVSVPQQDVENFGSVIPQFYSYMDEILGQIIAELEPGTNMMVVSDHGFGFDRNPMIPFRTGEHRQHGIFIAAGPEFQSGVQLDEVNVLDITPTLLYLFGLPVGRDMDGNIINEAIDAGFRELHSPSYIESYETQKRVSSITRSAADQQVRDQIRALGYVN